jgi:O-antigen/teichoic acid export membrane protein
MDGTGRPAWNLLTGTLTRYVLLGVNIALGIFLMPFTMHHLGQANYGLWMLVASMTAWFQLLDLGYGNGLVRQITQADAQGRDEEVNAVLSTFLVVYGAIGVVALGATGLVALAVLPRFPTLDPAQVATAQWVLLILGARVAIGFPMAIFGAVTTARQRFAVTGIIAIVVALLQGTATYVILVSGYGLVPLVAGTTSLNLLSYVAYVVVARRTFPGMRLSLARFSRRQVREVTAFSLYLFLISMAVQVGVGVDNLIIGAMIGTSAIAVYTVAVRLAEFQRQLCGQFSGLLFPLVVRFHANGDAHALRSTLLEGTRLALGLVGGLTLCLIVFGRDLVALWMGAGFEGSVVPLYVLAAAGIVMVAQGPTGMILLGTDRHRLVAWASVADLLLNLALSLALIGRFGLTGVALGTALPYAAINLFVLMPAACRAVGIPVASFVRMAAAPTLVALVPASLVAMALTGSAGDPSLTGLLVYAPVVGMTYVLAFWSVGLNARDRARYSASARALATGSQSPLPVGAP